jgi:hypothetical protein
MNDFLYTNQLGLIAALIYLGYKPMEIQPGKKVVYIFERSDALRADEESYNLGRLHVDAKGYFDATQGVKSTIFEITKNE